MGSRGPRDVCPGCGAHAPQEPLPWPEGACRNPFLRPHRCGSCGHVHAMCDLRYQDDAERAEAYGRKLAYHRAWYAANAERARESARRWCRENDANARARLRWRSDPAWRAAKLARAAEYQAAHPEAHREACRRYYEANREKCAVSCKRSRLRRWRRGQAEGDA